MPLWDSSRLQIANVPAASTLDPDADFFVYHDITDDKILRDNLINSAGVETFRFLLVRNISLPTPTVSLTLPFKRVFFPFRFKLSQVALTVAKVNTTGAHCSVDILSSLKSIFSNTTTVQTGQLVTSNNNYYGVANVHASMTIIEKYQVTDFYYASGEGGARFPSVDLIGWRIE